MLAAMTDSADDLPDDIERLKAPLLAERREKAHLDDQNERLPHSAALAAARRRRSS